MRRPVRNAAAGLLLVPPLALTGAVAAAGGDEGTGTTLPDAYALQGDPGGSTFEGIDVHWYGSLFYVTERTGGEVHRGLVWDPTTEVWLDEDVARRDGRTTAVGIAIDSEGRVYVAGGDNRSAAGQPPDAPDLWVYDQDGALLAALRVDADDVFLNDVAIGPDGAAYVTNSRVPQVFRVSEADGGWRAELFADAGTEAGGPIEQPDGFGLNGVEATPDGEALVVAQSDPGVLWRVDLATAEVTRIDTGDADLSGSDGLVVEGATLVAVRNFPRTVTVLEWDDDARSATLVEEIATDPERVLTTGSFAADRLLLVDSQFEEDPPSPTSEVVAFRLDG